MFVAFCTNYYHTIENKLNIQDIFFMPNGIFPILMLLTGKYLLPKVQELGLQAAYTSDDGAYRYIRKLMALPFLPHREIRPMFQLLRRQAQTQPLQYLVSYINK